MLLGTDYPNTDSYDLNGVRNQGPIHVALCFSQLAPGRYYYVVVQHSGRYWTRYAHMASVDVSAGQQVDRGTRLGVMGETGNADSRHVYVELITDLNTNTWIDFGPYLNLELP